MSRIWLSSAVFSLRSFAAAILALWLALSLDLARPSWAILTVYIVSQPLSGMTRSKSAYRILGTLIGAVFSVLAVPNLVNAPFLLCLVMALWLGLCLYASIMDGTPRGYAFMLAGYTAAIISFPSVNAPQAIFDNALARTEEICLGIVCVLMASYLPFSQRVGPLLNRQLATWIEDARHWAIDVLNGVPSEQDRLRLIDDAVQIDSLRLHARYDTPELRRAETHVVALQQQMQHYFALLTSIEDDYTRLSKHYPGHLPAIQPLLRKTAQWLEAPALQTGLPHLRETLQRHQPGPEQIRNDDGALQLYGLLSHLQEFIGVRLQCRRLFEAIQAGKTGARLRRSIARHRDRTQAFSAALAAFTCLMLCSGFWLVSGWPDGAGACAMAAIVCSFFATLDNPVPATIGFVLMINLGVVAGLLYQFMLLPHIDGFVLLTMVLATFYLPGSMLMARTHHYTTIMPFLIGITVQMGLETRFNADFSSALNGAMAQILGMSLAGITLKVMRSSSTNGVIQRLQHANQRDLRRVAASPRAFTRDDFSNQMADRIAGIVKRSTPSDPQALARIHQGLSHLQTGLAIFRLRQCSEQLPSVQQAVTDMLRALARDATGVTPMAAQKITTARTMVAAEHGHAADRALLALDDIARGFTPLEATAR